jgi:hypothetical protein
MSARQPRYSKEEFARRGDEIYELQVRPRVEADHQGKIVAIDLETQIWIVRVGSRHVRRFGGRTKNAV